MTSLPNGEAIDLLLEHQPVGKSSGPAEGYSLTFPILVHKNRKSEKLNGRDT